MRVFTAEELKNMTKEDAKRLLSISVYQATSLIDKLEGAGKIRGNGHHARQKLSAYAEEEVEGRWID